MSITVQNLVKRYGNVQVVHGISFEVAKGEFVSLLGPSGCGKTTTLRCIAGLEEADGGNIRIGSRTVSDAAQGFYVPTHDRQIGMVFQSYAIWPHLSVADNVGFPLTIRKLPAAQVATEVDTALEIVGMRHLRDRQPSQLSGGQQQRVALARAIVGHPTVLLFDEPLSNLDAKLREGTRSEIRRLQRELEVAAVYVTHDQEEALSMSDRVIVMDAGHVSQTGTPKELYRAPVNRFVADFVGRASFIDVTRGVEGEGWVTSGGARVHVAQPVPPAGERLQLMLRPEAVSFLEGIGTADNEMPGVITESQYLGAFTEYLVAAGGGHVKVHARADHAIGTTVVLGFSAQSCRLVAAPEATAS